MYISCSCSFMLAFSKKYRSSQRRFLLKKVKSCKFHRKTLALESLFKKVAGLKESPTQLLSCEICEIVKNTYFEQHLRTTTSWNSFCYFSFHTIVDRNTKLETGIPWLQSFNHFSLKQ